MIIKISYYPDAEDNLDAEAMKPEFEWVALSFERAHENIDTLEKHAEKEAVKESNRLADDPSNF